MDGGLVAYKPLALPPSNGHHFEYKSWVECRLEMKIKVKVTLKVKIVW